MADGTGPPCPLCILPAAVGVAVEIGGTVMTTAYADDELVALVDPGSPGVVLVPRSHVSGLGEMPGLSGVFLGALRRAVMVVRTAYGTTGAMIEPTTTIPGAGGHVAYRVVPTLPPGDCDPPPAPVVAASAVSEHLAEALGSG